MNSIYVKGNVTRDAEVYAKGDLIIAKFGLADNYKGKNGQESTTFYNVTAFGKTAEGCGSLKKGDRVMVDGRLDHRKYTDKANVEKYSLDLVANDVAVSVVAKGSFSNAGAPTRDAEPIDDAGIPF